MIGHVRMAEGVELPENFSPSWEIYHATANGEKGESVTTVYGATMQYNLMESGNYLIKVTADMASVEFPATIDYLRQNSFDESLEAGLVKLSGYMDGQTPVADGSSWELLSGSGSSMTTKYGATTSFLVPAGAYQVALTVGVAKTTEHFTVGVGQVLDKNLSLGAGGIEVTGYYSEGGDVIPAGLTVELRKFKPGLDGKHESITTLYDSPTIFKVLAGSYQIFILKDYASAAFDVDVKPGQVVKLSGAINAGFLAVNAPDGATIEIRSAARNISGEYKYVGTEYGVLNKAFPAGKYIVKITETNGELLEIGRAHV